MWRADAGPMLNLLLGVGTATLYVTIQQDPYPIEISHGITFAVRHWPTCASAWAGRPWYGGRARYVWPAPWREATLWLGMVLGVWVRASWPPVCAASECAHDSVDG